MGLLICTRTSPILCRVLVPQIGVLDVELYCMSAVDAIDLGRGIYGLPTDIFNCFKSVMQHCNNSNESLVGEENQCVLSQPTTISII